MSSSRVLLALLLLGAVAGLLFFAWRTSDTAVGTEPTRRGSGEVPLEAPLAGVAMESATPAARSLGIARSSFGGSADEPEERAAPAPELDRDQRRLLEKFKNGNLSRIGNAAVFTSPDARTLPSAEPQGEETGGGR